MFIVDGALVILHLYAVVAVATAFQFVARYFGMTLASASAVDILLIVRAPAAVLVSRLVGVVSRFSFAHSS